MRLFQFFISMFFLFVMTLGTACTRHEPRSFTVDAPALSPKTRLFPMDWQKVSALEIQKSLPEQDQPWSAQIKKIPDGEIHSGHWRIESASVAYALADSLADSRFIGHLIDTLSTLQMQDFALNGPLESFGLTRPAWVLKWTYEGKAHELRIGDIYSGQQRFAQIPGRTDEKGEARVVIIAGATLEMLSRLDSFHSLRAQTLLPFEKDDIDWIEVKKTGGRSIQAERLSESWAIPGTQKVPTLDIENLVEKLTHLRARTFLDESLSPEELQRKKTEIERAPSIRFRFQGPRLKETYLYVRWLGQAGLASVSSRPGIVFELHPEARKHF